MSPRERLKSPRLRLFVALDVPREPLERLVAWQQEALGGLGGLRLLPRESLHVTLVFLGYQAERDAERIAEICFSHQVGPFELRANELVGVPPRRPRLYAVSLEDRGGTLAAWQAALSRALERARLYEPEKRPFWSHLTVARAARNKPAPGVRESTLPADLRRPWTAERAVLYKSTLSPRGAIYDALAELELSRDLGTPRP